MTRRPTTLVVLGLPGTGKTRAALALGECLMASGRPALVLHTDLLKVTLRFGGIALQGAGYSGTSEQIGERSRAMLPYLQQQVDKAEKDGYWLIVEGTLALDLGPPFAQRILLTLDEATRLRRIATKHASAQAALERASLDAYRRCLEALPSETTLRIDSSPPPAEVVQRIFHSIV